MHEGYVPLIFFLMLSISDTFFGYVYIFFGSYFHPSGFFGFAGFPKIFLTLAIYFLYDDRLFEILGYSALTLAIHTFSGLAFEDFLLACHFEKINEFSTIDFYILMYLDMPVVFIKGAHNFKEYSLEFYDKLFKPKWLSSDADKTKNNDAD